jgi:hypothetical protein
MRVMGWSAGLALLIGIDLFIEPTIPRWVATIFLGYGFSGIGYILGAIADNTR